MNTSKSLRAALAAQSAARRGKLLAADCPSRAVLSHVTSRWGVLVLVVLLGGTHRFSQLRREVGGVSEKMLAQTLDGLVGDGFVARRALPVIPPHVEYSLTPMGAEVAARLEVLVDWIEDNFPRIAAARAARAAEAAGSAEAGARQAA